MKLQRILKLHMSGEDVKFLQTKLKEYGYFNERIDSYFGQNLLISVTNFQKNFGLKADGVVGSLTWNRLINFNFPERYGKKDPIDLNISFESSEGLKIYDCLLSDEEFVKEETKKNTIWLHHTAGGSRPDWTIGGWEKDFLKDAKGNPKLDDKGNFIPLRVATSFVIGRKSSSTTDSQWDGVILKAFDEKYWAYHLGVNHTNNQYLNSSSIAIELCNYGPLTMGKDGRFYNWVNKPIAESEVVELSRPFKGYTYYEKYTDAQLQSLRKLMIHLINKHGIVIEGKIYDENWFNYNTDWLKSGGIRSHSQVRKDKFDLFPQKEMIQMLNSL